MLLKADPLSSIGCQIKIMQYFLPLFYIRETKNSLLCHITVTFDFDPQKLTRLLIAYDIKQAYGV